MLNILVMVSGGGTNLQAIIDGINSGTITNTKIRAVFSNNKNAYALERAKKAGIEAVAMSPSDFPDRASFNKAMLDYALSLNVDLVVLAGCMVVIPPEFVDAFPNKIINIHPALIPSFCGTGYYGLRVHEEALKRGVKVTGATVHFVDKGTDTGPIIMQKAVEIKDDDTPEVLQRRVMEEAEWVIMPKVINLIANNRLQVHGNKVTVS